MDPYIVLPSYKDADKIKALLLFCLGFFYGLHEDCCHLTHEMSWKNKVSIRKYLEI